MDSVIELVVISRLDAGVNVWWYKRLDYVIQAAISSVSPSPHSRSLDYLLHHSSFTNHHQLDPLQQVKCMLYSYYLSLRSFTASLA